MRSYIKIYGPPVFEAIKALEKLAIDVPQVCIMDTIIATDMQSKISDEIRATDADTYSNYAGDYFSPLVPYPIKRERCDKIISKSGVKLGEFDFFFEWFKNPSADELNALIKRIDKALTPLECRYTITTKS